MPVIAVPPRIWDASPYKNFRYRLRAADGRYLGGFAKCRGLSDGVDVVDYQTGTGTSRSRQVPQLGRFGVRDLAQ
jgi:hypothetical protein